MTELEYRELLGINLNYHFCFTNCSVEKSLEYSGILSDTCVDILHVLRNESSFKEVTLSTALECEPGKDVQLNAFYHNEKLYIGVHDNSSGKIQPVINAALFSKDELSRAAFQLKKRCERLVAFAPAGKTSHVHPPARQAWLKYEMNLPDIEVKYRNDQQIVCSISPSHQAKAIVEELLDSRNAVYIKTERNGQTVYHLTQDAKAVLDSARENGLFSSMYEGMEASKVTSMFVAELEKYGEILEITNITTDTISVKPLVPGYEKIMFELDTNNCNIKVLKEKEEVLTAHPSDNIFKVADRISKMMRAVKEERETPLEQGARQ